MSNTRFITKNEATQSAVVLKNGTGGGAPARDEDTAFPMENAVYKDRNTVWKTSSAPTYPVLFDLDLGANKSVTVAGLHGLRRLGGGPADCIVRYSTSANGYPPVAASAWTTFGVVASLGSGPRDAFVLATQVSARYWRFEFELGSSDFELGKLLLGVVGLDMGLAFSPGSGDARSAALHRLRTMTNALVTFALGDSGRRFEYFYGAATEAMLSSLNTLFNATESFTLLAFDDAIFEIARLDALEKQIVFGPPNLYNVTLAMEALP